MNFNYLPYEIIIYYYYLLFFAVNSRKEKKIKKKKKNRDTKNIDLLEAKTHLLSFPLFSTSSSSSASIPYSFRH